MVDAHESDGQAGCLFAGQAGLEQADDTLLFLTNAKQEDAGFSAGCGGLCLSIDMDFVGGDDRNPAR